MLKIINNLMPFFEDCYRRISVREYAKIINVAPPTASKLLDYYRSEHLLSQERYRNYIQYHANKESGQFIDLSRIYWSIMLAELLNSIKRELTMPTIVLFGSLSKAEAKNDSDIDLAIFAARRKLSLSHFEKKLKRKIEMHWFKSVKDIKNKELANNIINGCILAGKLSL